MLAIKTAGIRPPAGDPSEGVNNRSMSSRPRTRRQSPLGVTPRRAASAKQRMRSQYRPLQPERA